ncbi:cysteine dioxygenase type I [Polychaeton citri CBS 116435]|uniref:Cysteine dioxygenase n=1 Tax=Polychaeton citri CBS 116435 TaxID=1314669 RepID=A0A9P4UII2_9PEZI|nr:cysteine dioxygenase type I [Polychaeton citri CBS 116435]
MLQFIENLADTLERCTKPYLQADINQLKKVVLESFLATKDWKPFAFPDHRVPYTRNLVHTLRGRGTLLVIVWTPGRSSPVHDHADSHCIMRILSGRLTETVYGWPGEEVGCSMKSRRTYGENEMTYITDGLGLHQMSNSSDTEPAVSLHLYTPPFIATHGCRTFDNASGEASILQRPTFYSAYGVKSE